MNMRKSATLLTQHKQLARKLQIALCLLLACLGTSWFAYQLFLVPQTAYFAPHWHSSQWIQARDGGNNATSYFRYSTGLNSAPDAAFVTIAANQVFSLYVNGTFIGSNAKDMTNGDSARAYIYDVESSLRRGPNVLAVLVSNLDQQVPSIRANLGIKQGQVISYYGTGEKWQATGQSALAYPRYTIYDSKWTARGFDATSWLSAMQADPPSLTPLLTVNPALYEQPPAISWMSAGAGHDAFFVRSLSLPTDIAHVWLRIVASGPASVFINGHLSLVWNGQARVAQQQLADYLSNKDVTQENAVPQNKQGLLLGVYDISPYVHVGTNTIAVHVTSAGNSAAQVGLQTLSTALALDILASDEQAHDTWITSATSNTTWHSSVRPVDGWTDGSSATVAWAAPLLVGRPAVSDMIYSPDGLVPDSTSIFPFAATALVILASAAAILGLWLTLSLFIMCRYTLARSDVLATLSIAYMPALGVEALLIALANEPLIPRPFPYTRQWGLILLALVGLGHLLLWLHLHLRHKIIPLPSQLVQLHRRIKITIQLLPTRLRLHWQLLLIILPAIPLISYQLSYEPYWQDELTSYYAAKGILAHGLPLLPSGFLYPKGELYSAILALCMALFGEQNGIMRLPGVMLYLASLPLFYAVACYFFDRKVALLATAMLAFSPYTLTWGRAVRMYELAQFMTILVMYLFYKATQESQRPHLIYLAMLALIIMYLSHEETFIFLPALIVGVLFASRNAILYQKHWWIAAALGASVIGIQLLIVKVTHPPVLGTDQSQQPLIQFFIDNLSYYLKLLFFPSVMGKALPMIAVNSLLAFVGCGWLLYRGNDRARYCVIFFLIPLLMLLLIFTPTADRYFYPLLPTFSMLGAFTLLTGLRRIWTLAVYAASAANKIVSFQPLRLLVTLTTTLVCISVLLIPVLPISNYSLATSRLLGLPYHRHYPDYDAAGQYIQQHWRKGDIVVSVSPAISTLYYVGHVDYFFSVDRALYLFAKDGHIIDTPTGTTPLLSQGDWSSVLSRHARIWIVTNKGLYQAEMTNGKRFLFPPDFRLVYQGYSSAVYLRG